MWVSVGEEEEMGLEDRMHEETARIVRGSEGW